MFPQQCLICISILAPLVFERQRPVTSIRADRAAPSTVFTMVSLPLRFWKEPVLRSQGRNGSRKERVREREGVRGRERQSKREQWRSKLVMAAGGWIPPSRPAVTHSPHTVFSLTNSYSLTITWFYLILAWDPPTPHPHTPQHILVNSVHHHMHTYPCCFGLSFSASIGSSIKIFRGREAPWSSDRDTDAWTRTKAVRLHGHILLEQKLLSENNLYPLYNWESGGQVTSSGCCSGFLTAPKKSCITVKTRYIHNIINDQ